MSAGSSSGTTLKRPAKGEGSGIAKRRALLFKDDNGLLETAITQSGIDMEQLTLNTSVDAFFGTAPKTFTFGQF